MRSLQVNLLDVLAWLLLLLDLSSATPAGESVPPYLNLADTPPPSTSANHQTLEVPTSHQSLVSHYSTLQGINEALRAVNIVPKKRIRRSLKLVTDADDSYFSLPLDKQEITGPVSSRQEPAVPSIEQILMQRSLTPDAKARAVLKKQYNDHPDVQRLDFGNKSARQFEMELRGLRGSITDKETNKLLTILMKDNMKMRSVPQGFINEVFRHWSNHLTSRRVTRHRQKEVGSSDEESGKNLPQLREKEVKRKKMSQFRSIQREKIKSRLLQELVNARIPSILSAEDMEVRTRFLFGLHCNSQIAKEAMFDYLIKSHPKEYVNHVIDLGQRARMRGKLEQGNPSIALWPLRESRQQDHLSAGTTSSLCPHETQQAQEGARAALPISESTSRAMVLGQSDEESNYSTFDMASWWGDEYND
ncbi:hypothetical protein CBS101457_003128 [Exobasidium rhododendri]|nr:hypothetical protein CBS101457_003128 [Exobasidium rhododendri]